MRILFAHNRYQHLGGEDLAARVERELLEKHGHTVDLFEADNAEILGLAGKTKAALGTVYSPAFKKRLAARIQSSKPSVVHVLNFFPLLSPSIHYACWEAGVPVVQKISNFRLICPSALLLRDGRVCEDCVGKTIPWPGVLHACYRNSWTGTAVVATMIATHRLLGTWEKTVDAYIARTNFSRDKLIEGGLPAEKIAIIPSFAPDPGDSGDASGRFALFAGRLSPEKGIATLLSAWDRLNGSSLRLKVAGDGPLREEVTRRADGGRVEYLGALPREKVQSLMREASFLVFPSLCYENFPLAIVEAFANGVPVIASRLGAMAEIIEDGRTGLHFCAGDPEDLATKIEWVVDHSAEMARMRCEARAEYLLKYTPERNYQLLMELYDRVIRMRSGSSAA
ncbi:MAG: glycosyltransferase family 4 protein [Candidatus Acidiferrales bacterium]